MVYLAAYSEGGFLLSYSVDMIELMRKAAGYVDKILKGAKPAELPVDWLRSSTLSSILGPRRLSALSCRKRF